MGLMDSDPKPVPAGKEPMVMELEPGNYAWCACGRSSKQPWCDGSHKGTGMRPLVFDLTETRRAAMCMCKKTKTPPYCDGSHRDESHREVAAG